MTESNGLTKVQGNNVTLGAVVRHDDMEFHACLACPRAHVQGIVAIAGTRPLAQILKTREKLSYCKIVEFGEHLSLQPVPRKAQDWHIQT